MLKARQIDLVRLTGGGLVFLVAGIGYVVLESAFGLGLSGSMLVLFWAGGGLAAALLVVLSSVLLGPLNRYVQARLQQEEVPQAIVQEALDSLPGLFARLGLVSGACAGAWLLLVGLLGMLQGSIGFGPFGALAIFAAILIGGVQYLLPQSLLASVTQPLTLHLKEPLRLTGLSLRGKTFVLALALGAGPALLAVYADEVRTRATLLDQLVLAQTRRLAALNRDVLGLLKQPDGQREIAKRISIEARSIGSEGFVWITPGQGAPFESDSPSRLSAEAEAAIREVIGRTTSDHFFVRDPASQVLLAVAVSADGGLWSVAPVIPPRESSGFGVWISIGLLAFLSALLLGAGWSAILVGRVRGLALMAEGQGQGQSQSQLQDKRPVPSDDEFADLGQVLQTLTENHAWMMHSVATMSARISQTCNQLIVKASAISTGAELQSQSVGEISQVIGELDSNIQTASESLGALVRTSAEAFEAATKIAESIGLMQGQSRGLQDILEQTGAVIERIGQSVSEVAQNISELSEGALRSAGSMAEMDRSISAVNISLSETARLASQAISVAEGGAVAVRRTIEGMDRIATSTKQASEVIVGLSERVQDIGSILVVIEEIADQTNLLALNAAIIAAQAGEHGLSFAVVADEIRSLAERTASSTREIAQMISDIQETSSQASEVIRGGEALVTNGVSLAKQAGDSLNQIVNSVEKAARNVEQIAGITESQSKSSEVVAREIARVADMAARITQSAEHQADAGRLLQRSFEETLATSRSMSKQIDQHSMENRQAMASVSSMKESASQARQALGSQAEISAGILDSIEQVREIAKNHAVAANEMGEETQTLAKRSVRLKDEIESYRG